VRVILQLHHELRQAITPNCTKTAAFRLFVEYWNPGAVHSPLTPIDAAMGRLGKGFATGLVRDGPPPG
jgi:hypothetical protein